MFLIDCSQPLPTIIPEHNQPLWRILDPWFVFFLHWKGSMSPPSLTGTPPNGCSDLVNWKDGIGSSVSPRLSGVAGLFWGVVSRLNRRNWCNILYRLLYTFTILYSMITVGKLLFYFYRLLSCLRFQKQTLVTMLAWVGRHHPSNLTSHPTNARDVS